MRKKERIEKTKRFDWKLTPQCKHQQKAKLPNGLEIWVCTIHKGSGRNKFVCTHKGVEPTCRYYINKRKWGRGIEDMVSDLRGY